MPSNKQLIAGIATAVAILGGESPDLKDATNAELVEMLREAKLEVEAKERADLEESAETDSGAAAKLAKEQANETKALPTEEDPPEFYVNQGKAITTKRGILSDGQEIKAEDLAGGADALEAFVASGHIGEG